ncbi:nuclear transport factor 2 family protein [Actinacidiphila sp. bgisy160]|uniref:nuclear transport factor 2 family protein n=1 Tax=Actinacidiphila sp. bgisy160 TaxID=3413796 RepID=UPI003D7302E5
MQEAAGQEAIDTFIAAFNASHDGYVPALLSRALTPDVVFWGPLGRSEGVAAVERFIIEMRGHPAGPGAMARSSAVDMPGEWARYQWAFRTAEGERELTGTDVVHLRNGRIDQMIVFAGELPPTGSSAPAAPRGGEE